MNARLYDRGQDTAISDNVERVCGYIKQLSNEKFYGDLVLKFQNGEIVAGSKQESFKPNFLVIEVKTI